MSRKITIKDLIGSKAIKKPEKHQSGWFRKLEFC